jgi:DNA (cytosine-5)-methyltransferase 1
MRAYYNDSDPFKCEVVREAIKAGAIAPGEVDERSIADVKPTDLMGYTQCHFFAGGGFWSLALRQAGWPDDRPVWTGSCPCPSFSAAGKGQGFADPRHLWPHWARLIRECLPSTIFGEQVSAAIGHGWLDLIQTDLEAQDYAVGKAVFGACSVGAPHIRQRLYFVANSLRRTSQWRTKSVFGAEETSGDAGSANGRCTDRSEYGGKTEFVAQSGRMPERRRICGSGESGAAAGTGTPSQLVGSGANYALADTADARRQAAGQYESGQPFFPARPEQCSDAGFLGDTEGRGLGMRGSTPGNGGHPAQPSEPCGVGDSTLDRNGAQYGEFRSSRGQQESLGGPSVSGSMDKPIRTGLERYCGNGNDWNQSGWVGEIPTGPVATTSKPGELADADGGNSGSERQQRSGQQRQQPQDGGIGELGISKSERRQSGSVRSECNGEGMESQRREPQQSAFGGKDTSGMADAELPEWWQSAIGRSDDEPAQAGWDESTSGTRERNTIERSGPVNGWWAGADWIGCRDGKFRPVPGTTESGPLSMVDGDFADLGYFLLPSGRGFAFSPLIEKGKERVGRLRLYGDAICIPAAQAFIESYLETEQ